MLLKCKTNSVSNPPILLLPRDITCNIDENNYVSSSEWYNSMDEGIFDYLLTIGKTYFVYALLIYDGLLRYLIVDDNGIPNFYPEYIFEIVDSKIICDWDIACYGINENEKQCIVVADKMLISQYEDLRDLIEQTNSSILRRFLDYKDYINEYYL